MSTGPVSGPGFPPGGDRVGSLVAVSEGILMSDHPDRQRRRPRPGAAPGPAPAGC